MQRKNWLKKMNLELLTSSPSEEEMNLIDLPPLTKRQQVRYLPKETSEQHWAREEIAKELGIEPMGGENPCERCANFGILCLPQGLLWVLYLAGIKSLTNLVLEMQRPVLPVPGQRPLASLSMQTERRGRQRKKWRGGHKREGQSNGRTRSGRNRCWKS